MMLEKRRHQRVTCLSRCIFYHDRRKYEAILENISISGALVKMNCPLPAGLHPGDTCIFILSEDQSVGYGTFKSKIRHMRSRRIGLQFIAAEATS